MDGETGAEVVDPPDSAHAATTQRFGRARQALEYVGGPVLAGFVSGVLIGGVGGRLAMLLLRLTSDDSLRGVQSDDGFTIGEVTGATVGLVVVMGILGAAGGVFYRVVRRWLPSRGRPLLTGLFFAALGGSVVIQPEGVDFVFLDPLWLAVALFIALPLVYGVVLSMAAEALIARPRRLVGARQASTVLLAPTLLAPPALVAVALAFGSFFVDDDPTWKERVDGPVVTSVVRALLLIGTVTATVVLAGNVAEIL